MGQDVRCVNIYLDACLLEQILRLFLYGRFDLIYSLFFFRLLVILPVYHVFLRAVRRLLHVWHDCRHNVPDRDHDIVAESGLLFRYSYSRSVAQERHRHIMLFFDVTLLEEFIE